MKVRSAELSGFYELEGFFFNLRQVSQRVIWRLHPHEADHKTFCISSGRILRANMFACSSNGLRLRYYDDSTLTPQTQSEKRIIHQFYKPLRQPFDNKYLSRSEISEQNNLTDTIHLTKQSFGVLWLITHRAVLCGILAFPRIPIFPLKMVIPEMEQSAPHELDDKEKSTLLLARERWISGYYDKAEKLLLKLLLNCDSEVLRVHAYLELGRATEDAEKFPTAHEYYEKAHELAEQLAIDNQKAWALVGLSSMAIRRGELESALLLSTKALKLFQENVEDGIGFSEVRRIQALHYVYVGEYDKSREIVLEVIKDLVDHSDLPMLGKVCLARAWNLLSAINLYVGDIEACFKACRKCRKVATKATDVGYRLLIATSVNNVGEAHKAQGEYETALTHYKEALRLNQQLGAERAISTSLHNLASIFSTRGEYQLASEYFERSLKLTETHGSDLDLSVLLGDMAGHEHLRGDFSIARSLFEKSIGLYRKLGSEEEISEKLCMFAGTLIELGELEEAERLIHEAETFARKHKSRYELARCRYQFGVLENIQENYGLARSRFSEAQQEAESLGTFRLAIESSISLAELAMRRYRLTLDPSSFDVAMEHVRCAEDLAEREHLHPLNVDTKMIISALFLTRLEFKESVRVLDEAIVLSKKYGLTLRLRQALAQKASVETRKASAEAAVAESEEMREFAVENAQRYMRIAVRRSRTPEMPEFDSSQLFITAIQFTAHGPEVLSSQQIPFPDQDPEELFLRMGVFYSAAIAQGDLHHQGLYGPLPLIAHYSSLIYAISLPDSTQLDTRMNGKRYTLFCFCYPSAFEPYFIDRDELQGVFEDHVASLTDLSLVTTDILSEIKDKIVELTSLAWEPVSMG